VRQNLPAYQVLTLAIGCRYNLAGVLETGLAGRGRLKRPRPVFFLERIMQPSRALFNEIGIVMAADTALLANPVAMHVHLAGAPFVPSLDLDVATLTEASFPGYGVVNAGSGTQLLYYDAASGLYTIQIREPALGWHWQTSGVPTPPQIIYGWYVTDHTDLVLIGAGLLTPPVSLTANGQGLDLPPLVFRFLLNSPN
jgi:hypothetical protein